ncbi:HhoA/HhoB/HtrA family serine endopeptidase [Spirulina major]|uniref:HhoA/HhoB/HtrA family serine endopeptidase n=1 Tax=Spirulina major TaxID=270636 RepID=UPI000934323D|nr:HhoA/HhoB/HtrA family serine endopeptidase [Spirulina major]
MTDSQTPAPSSPTAPRRFKWLTHLSLVVMGAGLAIGGQQFYRQPLMSSTPTGLAQAIAPTSPSIVPRNFVAEVVQQSGNAVVRIDASRTVKTQMPPEFNNPFFRQFMPPNLPDEQIQRGSGSGFITAANGEILTNAHVVDGADTVTVTLKDGRTFDGRVVGADPVTDVAVVKIDAENLPTVKIGDSAQLQPGEWAIAIGNPLGLDSTVTTGIISGTGRSSSQVGIPDKRVNFIQTDAAINPGNSGGPLLNDRGEVIGINTAIIRNAQGLGFAIPINQAQDIAAQLMANGRAEHAFVGIQMVPLTPEVRQQAKQQGGLDIQSETGVLIVQVAPNSPADRAGLQPGDVVQQIAGQGVDDPSVIQNQVSQTKVGDRLTLQVDRAGRSLDINVTVGTLEQ